MSSKRPAPDRSAVYDEDIRQLVWDAMLEADFRARYFGEIASRLSRKGQWLDTLLAVITSAAFVTIIADVGWNIPEATLLVAVILNWISVFQKFGESAKEAASIYRQWNEFSSSYQLIWSLLSKMSTREVLERFQAIQARQHAVSEQAASRFPNDRALANKCFDEMLRSRGIDDALRAA